MAENGNGPKPVGMVQAPGQVPAAVAAPPAAPVAAPVAVGQLQATPASFPPPAPVVVEASPVTFEKGPLLQKVRSMMRGNYENRTKWCAFCQVHGTPNFKPELQDEAFLLTFLDALQGGGIPDFTGDLPAELQEPADWKGGGKCKGGDAWGGKGGDAWGGKGGKDPWGGKGGGDAWGGKGGGGDAWGGKGGGGWGGKDGGKGAKAGGGGGGGGGGNVGKIFVGGLPKTTTEDTLQGYFGQWGAVSNVIVKYGEDGMCKGFGFVTFTDPAHVQAVVAGSQAGTTMIDGKWCDCKEVDQSLSGSGQKGGGGGGKGWDDGKGGKGGKMALSWDGGKGKGAPKGKGGGWDAASTGSWGGSTTASGGSSDGKVFVGGLPKTAPEAAIQGFFSQYGAINNILMKYDETGTSRGFCFVEFAEPSVKDAVIAASQQAGSTMFEGRWIDCKDPVAGKGGKDKGGKGCWDDGKGAKRQKVDEWGGWAGGGGGGGGWDKGGFGKGKDGGFGTGCKGKDGGKKGGFKGKGK